MGLGFSVFSISRSLGSISHIPRKKHIKIQTLWDLYIFGLKYFAYAIKLKKIDHIL